MPFLNFSSAQKAGGLIIYYEDLIPCEENITILQKHDEPFLTGCYYSSVTFCLHILYKHPY